MKHLSSKKERKPKKKNQRRQLVIDLLPKVKEFKLQALSLEEVKTEENALKEASPNVPSPKEEQFFENQINLVSVKTVAEMLGLVPKTIHIKPLLFFLLITPNNPLK